MVRHSNHVAASLNALCREAWNKLGDMAQDAAKASYMELVDRLDPGWDNNPINIDTKVTCEYSL